MLNKLEICSTSFTLIGFRAAVVSFSLLLIWELIFFLLFSQITRFSSLNEKISKQKLTVFSSRCATYYQLQITRCDGGDNSNSWLPVSYLIERGVAEFYRLSRGISLFLAREKCCTCRRRKSLSNVTLSYFRHDFRMLPWMRVLKLCKY